MIDGAPETTVPIPPIAEFGTKVPALLAYNDEGECVHAVFGADIQPFVDWVASLGPIEPLHFKMVAA